MQTYCQSFYGFGFGLTATPHKGSDVLTISHDVLISLRPHREKTYSSIFANMANYNQNIIATPFSAKKTSVMCTQLTALLDGKKIVFAL